MEVFYANYRKKKELKTHIILILTERRESENPILSNNLSRFVRELMFLSKRKKFCRLNIEGICKLVLIECKYEKEEEANKKIN
jgi:hypothetical protein